MSANSNDGKCFTCRHEPRWNEIVPALVGGGGIRDVPPNPQG